MESTNTPAIKAAADLPPLPKEFGCIDIYEDSGRVRSVDGFTADQMRGYALDYANQLGRAALATPAIQAVAPIPPEPVELIGIAEQLKADAGFWHSCSGCHETEDGHPVGNYAYSAAMRCALGNGCSECGGLGAVWDNNDYSQEPVAAVPAQAQQEDMAQHVKLLEEHVELQKDYNRLSAKFEATKAAPAAPVAPDLASLTRWEFGFEALRQDKFGDYVLLADVERLLSHSAQAPVEPVSALTDERARFEAEARKYGYSLDRVPTSGCYSDDGTQDAWKICRALLAASPKVEPVSEDKRDAERYQWIRRADYAKLDSIKDKRWKGLDDAVDAFIAATPSPTKEST